MLKDNLEYIEAFRHNDIVFYMPLELTGYHKSRELAMQAQDQYSRCGISKEVLASFTAKMLELANKQNNTDTLKTDIGIIANNLNARMQSPMDELCAIRMGAIACFLEEEDPNKVSDAWTNKKLKLADQYPEIYAFFLDTGIGFTPEYANQWRTSQAEDYFQKRSLMLNGLMPQSTPQIS